MMAEQQSDKQEVQEAVSICVRAQPVADDDSLSIRACHFHHHTFGELLHVTVDLL
jgi:hypothetical protein